MNLVKLKRFVLDHEEWLMDQILSYEKDRNYVKYTSTLKEAWRMSVSGLSSSLIEAIDRSDSIPELSPDDDYTHDAIAAFGIIEAQKHRARGLSLSMFLGLMKYYQQAYIDLIHESNVSPEEERYFLRYLKGFFDRLELGFIMEWSESSEQQKLLELQSANRAITNEKNKYLTVFKSIYDPIVLVDQNNQIENINQQALETIFDDAATGKQYYGDLKADPAFEWLVEALNHFIAQNKDEIVQKKTVQTKSGKKTFTIKFKKMLDVSEKYSGTVIIFNDITERLQIESKLIIQRQELESIAFTDQMTGVANRRTGLIALETALSLTSGKDTPLSICFLDVDGLKTVNDTYGHLEGDSLLTTIVTMLKTSVRETDTICRMGGDEFLIIFPDCNEDCSKMMLQQATERLNAFDATGEKPYKHSFSYGSMEISGHTVLSANEVIKTVDARMYQNKHAKKQHTMDWAETK